MTIEEMLNDFSSQKDEIVKEIKDLENEILKKKEQFFRLQGAVEALTYAANSDKDGLCAEEDCNDKTPVIEELPPAATDSAIADPIV